MKSKDTQKRENIPPLDDEALGAVTGGWLPDITLPNPDSPNNDSVIVITRVCSKCGKQFTRRGAGSCVLCDKCAPAPTILTPITPIEIE